MSFRGMRLPLVAAALISTLFFLLAGKGVGERYAVTSRVSSLGAGIKQVEEVWIERERGVVVLHARVGEVESLAPVYARLEKAAASVSRGDNWRVVLEDNRDGELQAMYETIHYFVEEAACRGNFSEMVALIRLEMNRMKPDRYRIFVDAGHVYVQIHRGNRNLYEVVPRPYPSPR